jgi:hypothetical protein
MHLVLSKALLLAYRHLFQGYISVQYDFCVLLLFQEYPSGNIRQFLKDKLESEFLEWKQLHLRGWFDQLMGSWGVEGIF